VSARNRRAETVTVKEIHMSVFAPSRVRWLFVPAVALAAFAAMTAAAGGLNLGKTIAHPPQAPAMTKISSVGTYPVLKAPTQVGTAWRPGVLNLPRVVEHPTAH
jgi:hypothetical protein